MRAGNSRTSLQPWPAGRFHGGHPQLRRRAQRAGIAAGLTVIECEQPNRKPRRGRGKSDAIDAHLVVMTALRLRR
jgi:hypothetical protein